MGVMIPFLSVCSAKQNGNLSLGSGTDADWLSGKWITPFCPREHVFERVDDSFSLSPCTFSPHLCPSIIILAKEYPTLAPLYEWSIWMHGSNLNKNYLPGEKFAELRFKLLIVDFYLFFLLLFICLWNILSEIHHNLAVVLFCGNILGSLGISKQGLVVSHSWHVYPCGTSGFGDGAMSVQLSSHLLFLVCWLKSDPLMLFYLFFKLISSSFCENKLSVEDST